jgi:hypothetical protein
MNDPLLQQLITLHIPEAEPTPIGFLELCSQSHRETVVSSVYASFLDRQINEAVAELFLSTLLEVSGAANVDGFQIEDYRVVTEWATDKARIDLVVLDKKNRSAFIIENKIYHYLANDLNDYWDALESHADHRVGIVLALTDTAIPKDVKGDYRCITHKQWMDAIEQRGLPPGLDPKFYVYLNDFIHTLKRLSTPNLMDSSIRFFFQHQDQMVKANALYNKAQEFIMKQLAVFHPDNGWKTYGANTRWFQFWPKNQKEDIYYAVVFEELIRPQPGQPPKFTLYLQIDKLALEREKELIAAASDFQKSLGFQFGGSARSGAWKHLLHKEYVLDIDQLDRWGELLYEEVTVKYADMYEALLGVLRKTH